jgi:hypothetical protein
MRGETNMRKSFFVVAIALFLAITTSVQAELFPLYSGATGTTKEVASSVLRASEEFTIFSCDIMSSPATTVNYRIENNLGYLASWPTNSTSAALISQGTCTLALCQVHSSGKVVYRPRSVISTPSNTAATIGVYCRGK